MKHLIGSDESAAVHVLRAVSAWSDAVHPKCMPCRAGEGCTNEALILRRRCESPLSPAAGASGLLQQAVGTRLSPLLTHVLRKPFSPPRRVCTEEAQSLTRGQHYFGVQGPTHFSFSL